MLPLSATEVMVIGGESTATNKLNQHVPNDSLWTFFLVPTDKCSLPLSPRKLLLATNGDHRKPQPIKMQSCGVQSQWIHLQNILIPESQGTLMKRGHKDCKSQRVRIREFALRLCLLVTPEAIPMRSQQHDCPNVSWTRMMPMGRPDWCREAHEASTLHKNYRQPRESWKRESTSASCSVLNDHPENIYTYRVYVGLYMCEYIHMQ